MNKFSLGLIINLLIKFSAVAIGLFTTKWVASLPETDFALYNIVVPFNQIILQTIDLGIPLILQRYYTLETNVEKLKKVWTTFSILRIVSYFVSILMIFAFYPISGTNQISFIILLFTGQFIILADNNFRSICNAYGKTWQFSLTDLLGKIILVISLFVIYRFLSNSISPLIFFAMASIGSYLFSFVLDAIWQKEHTKWDKFDFELVKADSKAILTLGISTVAVATFLNSDKLYLKNFRFDDYTINSYSIAYKMFELASIVVGLTMPQLASLATKKIIADKNNFMLIAKFLVIVFLIGLACTLGLVIVGPYVIAFIDNNNNYNLSLELLPLLSVAFMPMIFVLFLGQVTIFFGGEKYELISTIFMAVVINALYFFLIPIYGAWGAAWSTLLGYTFELFVRIFYFYKILKVPSR